MEQKKLTEKNLFINLDETQVFRGSLADVICQGTKALQAEIEATEEGTRKHILVGCLYQGLFYHYLVLGCSEDDAEKRATEQAEKYGKIPREYLEMKENSLKELCKS